MIVYDSVPTTPPAAALVRKTRSEANTDVLVTVTVPATNVALPMLPFAALFARSLSNVLLVYVNAVDLSANNAAIVLMVVLLVPAAWVVVVGEPASATDDLIVNTPKLFVKSPLTVVGTPCPDELKINN